MFGRNIRRAATFGFGILAARLLLIAPPAHAMSTVLALSRTCSAANTALHSYSDDNVAEVMADMTAVEGTLESDMENDHTPSGLDVDLLIGDIMAFVAQYDNQPRGKELLQQFVDDNCS